MREFVQVIQRGSDLVSASLILANRWPQCQSILDTVAQRPAEWFVLEIKQARDRLQVKLVPVRTTA